MDKSIVHESVYPIQGKRCEKTLFRQGEPGQGKEILCQREKQTQKGYIFHGDLHFRG